MSKAMTSSSRANARRHLSAAIDAALAAGLFFALNHDGTLFLGMPMTDEVGRARAIEASREFDAASDRYGARLFAAVRQRMPAGQGYLTSSAF